MAVALDAQSFADLTGSGGTWTHTPVGTPRGIAVLIASQAATTDVVTTVSFGGAALTRQAFATVGGGGGGTHSPGSAYLYFLGSAVPASGTVNITNVNASGTFSAWAVTVQANQAWTQMAASAVTSAGSASANPSGTVQSAVSASGMAIAVLFSGATNPSIAVPNAGCLKLTGSFGTSGRDFGTQSAAAEYFIHSGGPISIGWTIASNYVVLCAADIMEVPPTVLPPTLNFGLAT